eukprot:10099585-Alexandrium_andersonii.AAC.1
MEGPSMRSRRVGPTQHGGPVQSLPRTPSSDNVEGRPRFAFCHDHRGHQSCPPPGGPTGPRAPEGL